MPNPDGYREEGVLGKLAGGLLYTSLPIGS